MKLNKPVKVIIGLATGAYSLFPVIFIPIWFLAVISAAMGSNYLGEPPPFFFAMIFSLFPLICLFNLLHFVLVPFYLIHIIKNDTASDLNRILPGIGLFFLPWLAMPIYYFMHIWPENPPTLPSSSGSPEIAPDTPTPEARMSEAIADAQIESEIITGGPSGLEEQESDALSSNATVIHSPAPAAEVKPASQGAETGPAQPAEESQSESETKEAVKPARKSRRKQVEKAAQDAPPEGFASSEPEAKKPEPPNDATIIGPSPVSGEPIDES